MTPAIVETGEQMLSKIALGYLLQRSHFHQQIGETHEVSEHFASAVDQRDTLVTFSQTGL